MNVAQLAHMIAALTTAVPKAYPRIVRVSIPESKLWCFLDNLHLRRTHQPLSRKDERVLYVTCNTAADEDTLNKRIVSI